MRAHGLILGPLSAVAICFCPAISNAQPKGAAPAATPAAAPALALSKDAAPIRAAIETYRAALAKKDIDAIAACWTAGADYVDQVGRVYQVQAGLARAKRLGHEDSHVEHLSTKSESLSIRFVTPEVAIEDGEFVRAGVQGGQAPTGLYTAIWVNKEGKWLIDGLRESPIRGNSMTEPLKDMEWMIGDWVAEGTDRAAEVSARWASGKSSILVQMKMQIKGSEPITAVQLIGWDPVSLKVRSFLFDSRGLFVEGNWTNEGDAWAVDAVGAVPSGKRILITKLYSRIDDNTAIWESIDDSEETPGTDVRLKLTRKPVKK
jgi:ketosteroid isomerase-like protein